MCTIYLCVCAVGVLCVLAIYVCVLLVCCMYVYTMYVCVLCVLSLCVCMCVCVVSLLLSVCAMPLSVGVLCFSVWRTSYPLYPCVVYSMYVSIGIPLLCMSYLLCMYTVGVCCASLSVYVSLSMCMSLSVCVCCALLSVYVSLSMYVCLSVCCAYRVPLCCVSLCVLYVYVSIRLVCCVRLPSCRAWLVSSALGG